MLDDNLQANIAILNATSELQDLLMRTLQAACALTRASEARILLYDATEKRLTVYADYEQGQLKACHVVSIAALYTPFINEPNQPAYEDITSHGMNRLVMPLVARRSLVGLLHLERNDPFETQDKELLTVLASYSAVTLQNAYLYERAANTNRELHLLVEASNAVSTSLDLDEVLQAITRYMMRALHADWCLVCDYDDTTGSLLHIAENRNAHWPEGVREKDDIPARLRALENSQIYTGHINDDDWQPFLVQRGAKQVLGIPIHDRGSIEIYMTHGKSIQQGQVAGAVRAAMMLAAKFDELTPDLLARAARTALEPHESLWCSIMAWNGSTFRRIYTAGYGLRQAPHTFELEQAPHLSISLNEMRVAELYRDRLNDSEEEFSQLDERDMELMVTVPLMIKNKVNGLVQLMFTDPHHQVKEREVGLASSIARQAAIALENARLVRDLQHSLERQQSMQAQLVRAARLSVLGELSATLAHQISNPLTIILGDAQILLEDLKNDVDRESADAIFKAGKRAKQVVERILKMARHEEVPERQNINKTIKETLDLLHPQINRQGIAVSVELPPTPIWVMAAPGQLEDIWSNLLINARDAVLSAQGRRGRITIRATENEDTAQITISDNGVGIPQQKLEGVFNPLYTTKPMGQGTGLGLYVVQQILDTLYGDIDIKSTVGEGTEVRITLPLSQMEDAGG